MAKNRRSGNTGDTTAYGNDTAELLNNEEARLIADSMRTDNAEKQQKRGRRSKRETEELSKAEKTEKPCQISNQDPGKPGEVSKSTSGNLSRRSQPAERMSKPEDRPAGNARKTKLITERAAAEVIETAPRKRNRKSIQDPGGAETPAEDAPKKRGRKAKPVIEEAEVTAEEKSLEQDDESGRGGCKTRQVMKLIEGDNDNLVIFAGKSRVPNLLRGRESLSAMMRKNAAGLYDHDDTEVVNITELVIRHEAAGILDRFNACSCERCVNAFSDMIAKRIPIRYARISRAELDSGELPERAVSMRQVVLPEMIRQLICNKKRCFHDE